MKPKNPAIRCKDGFTMSVQAKDGAYCSPREDYPNTPYTHVECGYPSSKPVTKELREFAECLHGKPTKRRIKLFGWVIRDGYDYTETVYGYVPVEVVEAEFKAHGGIVEGKFPVPHTVGHSRDDESTDAQLKELGLYVVELAYDIFCQCDAEEDFCIQSRGVFGGTNRLVYGRNGFKPDPSYCTEGFLNKWLEIEKEE